jgi:hypothetical protein
MSKFKIEHGASKVRLVTLKTNIEDSISNDIDLMCEWSDNERKYIVNELLRFALTQEEDFLKYKASRSSNPSHPSTETKAATSPVKSATEPVRKPGSIPTNSTTHA